ncbi:class I SAM-dependent methyltransferase [Tunturiibacter gelidoferens]|uniref:Class I SAM-dependent methyltransferase n=1 Tax=Tunturiibacter gelidiferens TaxID=3069689 RepID=A0AAU7YZW4_9BACT
MQTFDQSSSAFELRVRDPAMRAYLQRHPFLVGPDREMNEKGRQAVRDGLVLRNRDKISTQLRRLTRAETRLTSEQMDRLNRIMDESEVPKAARRALIDDYAWEAKLVPSDSKSVLVIGCADGTELMFLRAVLPDAKITALDYEDSIPDPRKRAINVRFFHGDMNTILTSFGQEFDLISSNHTLEHLYTPNETLKTLSELLISDGALISTLPMDGHENTPFLDKVKAAASGKAVYPLDVVYLDAGHPWKTNPADLVATMQETGFERPLLFQRRDHLSRTLPFGERRFKVALAFAKAMHAILFASPRSVIRVLFPNSPPKLLSSLLMGAERRLWFGPNKLKNNFTQEVLVLARKSSSSPYASGD